MKNNYIQKSKTTLSSLLIAVAMLLASSQTMAQTVKVVDDGAILSDVINGDTTATGERNDENTIYELKMGGIYHIKSELNLKTKLHIRSEGGDGFLPAIIADADESNKYSKIINTKGDIILEGIYLSNKNGNDANPKWGGFRAAGTDSRVILKDCQFEHDKACTIQLRADGIKVYIENCIASKTGNFKEYNGNGRLVDTRGYKTDSIVVKNTTVYYMQDRLVRNMGGEINYLEFDHVTVVNNQGMHGCFAMAKVHHAKITNNLVINGMYGGNHPNVSEQTGPSPDNENIYLITMDTVFSDTELEIHHNNFAFTSDLLDYFNTIDSVSKPEVLAPIVKTTLGAAASAAYFEEVVEFTNMPDVPWDFLRSIYNPPADGIYPSNWPDEIGIANIDAGYDVSSASATADEDGGPVGSSQWMNPVSIFDNYSKVGNALSVNVYPNPVKGEATFAYTLNQASNVNLTIYDVTGKVVKAINTDFQATGDYQLQWDGNNVANGLYLYSLQTKYVNVSGKITLDK